MFRNIKTNCTENVVIKKQPQDNRSYRKKMPSNFYNPIAVRNRQMGNKNEKIVLKVLSKWFENSEFKEDQTGWGVIDFVDDKNKFCVELKSRRIKKWGFPSIIIGKNKYIQSRKMMMKGYKAFFLFKFSDRICFYPVPMILPECIEKKKGGTDKRGKNEMSDCLYIPMGLLYDIEDFDNYEDFKNKHSMV
jgi:hypothetical protein